MKERVKELLDNLDTELSSAMDEINEASSSAGNAWREAEDAQNNADNARSAASEAEDAADRAERHLREVEAIIEELSGILEEGEETAEVSLTTQLKRYTPKILDLHRKGCSADDIARRLSISEVIVNIALERQDAA